MTSRDYKQQDQSLTEITEQHYVLIHNFKTFLMMSLKKNEHSVFILLAVISPFY